VILIPFTWKNCHADVLAWRYPLIAKAFMDDVIEPTITSPTMRIANLVKSEEPGDAFAHSDVNDLFRLTTTAFCLSIQSIWERQIRSYVAQCASELEPANGPMIEQANTGKWEAVETIFTKLRGIKLSAFPSYPELQILNLVANACRHGNGPSATKLWRLHPEFWPSTRSPTARNRGRENGPLIPPPADLISIPVERLHAFTDAIVEFWEEADYIYLESIDEKHISVIEKLEVMRRARKQKSAKTPSAPPSAGLQTPTPGTALSSTASA
jgi:hypothetical protein